MIEITLPEWLGWIIAAAVVLHAIKSVMEIYLDRAVGKLMDEEGIEQTLAELREIAKQGKVEP